MAEVCCEWTRVRYHEFGLKYRLLYCIPYSKTNAEILDDIWLIKLPSFHLSLPFRLLESRPLFFIFYFIFYLFLAVCLSYFIFSVSGWKGERRCWTLYPLPLMYIMGGRGLYLNNIHFL
jgi:hypothetical protein